MEVLSALKEVHGKGFSILTSSPRTYFSESRQNGLGFAPYLVERLAACRSPKKETEMTTIVLPFAGPMDLRLRCTLSRARFTAVAVLTLALGIGINTVVFTRPFRRGVEADRARAPQELVRISGIATANSWKCSPNEQYDQTTAAQSFSDTSRPPAFDPRWAHAGSRRRGSRPKSCTSVWSPTTISARWGVAPIGRGFRRTTVTP